MSLTKDCYGVYYIHHTILMSQLVRTQIYLPVKLKQAIKSQAKLRNRSFSDLLRDFLEACLEEQQKKQGDGALSLARMAKRAEEEGANGPSDLAINHDYYLYGDGSPKFGKQNI